MDKNEYKDLFLTALAQVKSIYYSHEFLINIDTNIFQLTSSQKRKLKHYGERIFCYELYHQLSPLILNAKCNQLLAEEIYLQGELQKRFITIELLQIAKLQKLEHDYIPDFILHDPQSAAHQEFVVEVKNAPDLSASKVKTDILKLNEFVSRYRFKLGIFLAVNISSYKAEKFWKSLSSGWIQENIKKGDQEKIICIWQENPESDIDWK